MDFQKILNKWNIKCDVNTLLAMWNEPHRHYHSLIHLNDIIDQINGDRVSFSEKEYEMLIIAALFHDCIYDPMSRDNEEKSAEFFMNCCIDKNYHILKIKDMILETKNHIPTSRISSIFILYDMNVIQRDFDQLMEWENGISLEYSQYDIERYKKGRIRFLESLLDKNPYIYNADNILKLINYVKSK